MVTDLKGYRWIPQSPMSVEDAQTYLDQKFFCNVYNSGGLYQQNVKLYYKTFSGSSGGSFTQYYVNVGMYFSSSATEGSQYCLYNANASSVSFPPTPTKFPRNDQYITYLVFVSGDALTDPVFIEYFSTHGTLEQGFTEVDISELVSDAGTYQISASASAVGFGDSEKSEAVQYSIYTVTSSVVNGSASGAGVIKEGKAASVTIVPDTGCRLPHSVTVTGASHTYNDGTGVIVLSGATGSVTISAECVFGITAPSAQVSNIGYLCISDEDGRAESYDVFIDGVFAANVVKGA